ncbi:MAG TPA: threonine-phosphate decarboxylase [Nitrospirae bacterium]|nr:threonine-phosphate decarboxylase [Nitrospirota bacterium]
MELIRTQNPEHGGNIYKIAEYLGIPEEELIDFSASINPLGVSGRVKDVIKKDLDNLINYPDPDTRELRKAIARYHDSDPETIICGNGSTELIYLIPRALGPGRVLITAPAFSEYERAVLLSGQESGVRSQELESRGRKVRIKYLNLKEEDRFRINPEEFIEAMKGCDMAFLCNPNNPTGHLLGKMEVLGIAEAAGEIKCLLVVDEAFIDFCPETSVINDVPDNPYLVVLRSMTKFYALTGLRIGYGVFHEDLIGRIKKFKEPWTVNNLAQKAAIAALDDISYADETMRLMKDEKQFLEHGFQEAGIEFFPSAANYYLLRIDNAGGIVKELRQKGILVRDCSNFKGLDGSYIRVAVKSRRHNGIMLKELLKLCRA